MYTRWFSFEGRLMIFLAALTPLIVYIFDGSVVTSVILTVYVLLSGGALLTEYGPGFLFKRESSRLLEQLDDLGFLLHFLLHPMSLVLTVAGLYWFQYVVSVTGEWMWLLLSATMALIAPGTTVILYALRRGIDSMSGPDNA